MQGRNIEDLQYGAVDVVGKAQLAKRGGRIVEPIPAVERAALDISSLLNSASQGQDSAASAAGGQQGSETVDASAILNGLNGATTQSQGQGQASVAAGQQGGAGVDVSALLNGVTGAAGSASNGQQAGGGIDANAILNGLTGGSANAAAAGNQGQASADIAALLAEQQKGNGAAGVDINGLLNSLGQTANAQSANGANAGGDASNLINNLLNGISGQSNAGTRGTGQGQGNGVQIIEIKESLVAQINGAGAVKETIIQGVGGGAGQTAVAQGTVSTSTVFRL